MSWPSRVILPPEGSYSRGRLPRAALSHQGQPLARGKVQIDFFENGHLRSAGVEEPDVLKGDLAPDLGGLGREAVWILVGNVRKPVNDFENAIRRDATSSKSLHARSRLTETKRPQQNSEEHGEHVAASKASGSTVTSALTQCTSTHVAQRFKKQRGVGHVSVAKGRDVAIDHAERKRIGGDRIRGSGIGAALREKERPHPERQTVRGEEKTKGGSSAEPHDSRVANGLFGGALHEFVKCLHSTGLDAQAGHGADQRERLLRNGASLSEVTELTGNGFFQVDRHEGPASGNEGSDGHNDQRQLPAVHHADDNAREELRAVLPKLPEFVPERVAKEHGVL